jgi:hypothetical protein
MLNNYLVNYEECPVINNIEYSNIENVNPFVKKIKFYNPDITEPLHKFWFYIKNAKLIKKGSMTLQIALSNKETKLIECMQNLDKKIYDILHKKNEKYNIRPSLIMSANYPPVITLGVDSTSKCYDTDNNLIDYMGIRNGAILHIFVEFESVTIGSDECIKKWKVLQIKENKPLDMSLNFFEIQSSVQINSRMQLGGSIPISPPPPPPPPMQLVPAIHSAPPIQLCIPPRPPAISISTPPPKNNTSSGFCPPSLNDLLGSISKLKKAKTNEKIEPVANTISPKNIDTVISQDIITVKDDIEYTVIVKEKEDTVIAKDKDDEQDKMINKNNITAETKNKCIDKDKTMQKKQETEQYIAKIKREHEEYMINHDKSIKIAQEQIDIITACIEKKKKQKRIEPKNDDDDYDPFFMT